MPPGPHTGIFKAIPTPTMQGPGLPSHVPWEAQEASGYMCTSSLSIHFNERMEGKGK